MGHLTGLFIEVALILVITWRVMIRVERYRQSLLPDSPEVKEHVAELRRIKEYSGPLDSDRIPTHAKVLARALASQRTTSGGTTVQRPLILEIADGTNHEPDRAE